MSIWTPLNALGFTISPTMVNADEVNMTAEDFANELAAGNATVQPQGVEFNYLGAGSPMLDYKGDEEGYRFTDNYDPAFGELESYISGDTGYPQQNETVRTEEFDLFEEIPSLQRRLGNPRFSLGQPQNLGFEEESETISTPVYQDRIMNRNLPGFAYESPKGLASIINSQLRNAKTNVGQKVGQGFDFAKQLPGMAMSALTGIPGIGALMGMLPKTSPEQKAMMDLYNSQEYQDLLGQIPGMENYNPVYGMGAGYGLSGAIGKRLAMRNSQKTQDRISKLSKERQDKFKAQTLALEKLAALEAEKDFARIGASGRRPGSGSGPTVGDSQSRGQASAGNTGGYSYDRGGRKGYGYGLKYGGRVGYANGGLASLFTRRG